MVNIRVLNDEQKRKERIINRNAIFRENKSQSKIWPSVNSDFLKKKDELVSIFKDYRNIYLIGWTMEK